MSSRQEHMEESTEAQSREAAREITHQRTERARVVDEEEPQPAHVAEHHNSAGILQSARSFLGAVGRTLGVAREDKEADKLVGEHKKKAREVGDAGEHKSSEYKDYTADKVAGMKDATAHKASDAAEATKNMLGEYKDSAAEMAKETKDSAAEKASQTADAPKNKLAEYRDVATEKAKNALDAAAEKAAEVTMGGAKQSTNQEFSKSATEKSSEEKLEEYKQSAADASRKAMEYLTLRTEEVKEQSGASKAGVDTTEELARQEIDATRQRTEQVAEAERRWKEDK